MSTVTAIRPRDLNVTTSYAHVKAAHENYSRKVPDLCGRLVEDEGEIRFRLFVPELGQVLTYRAPILGGAA